MFCSVDLSFRSVFKTTETGKVSKLNERTSTQAYEVSFFRRIHTPHIPLYCDASVGVCDPTLKNHAYYYEGQYKPNVNTRNFFK